MGIVRSAWFGYAVVAVTLQLTADAVIADQGDTWNAAWYGLFSLAELAVVLLAVRRFRPARRSPWLVLAASFLCGTSGSALEIVYHLAGDSPEWLFNSYIICYWAYYPTLALALAVTVRLRSPGRHLPTLIDTAVLAVAVSLVWWIYVVQPSAAGLVWMDLLFPLPSMVLFAVVVRLMLSPGERSGSYRLLMGGAGVLLFTDAINGVALIGGISWPPALPTFLFALSDGLVVAAALHPSMARIGDVATTPRPPVSIRRLAALGAATLVPAAILLIEHQRGRHDQIPVIAVGCAVLYLLVVVQLHGLIQAQRKTAITDALTGLHTRTFYDEELRRFSARHSRGLSMIIVDADHFKDINDRYGHPAGDDVLRELARRIRSACRVADVVARYGGEEFVVLLPHTTIDEAVAIGERIRSSVVDSPIELAPGLTLPVTVSAGVAAMPVHAATADELLRVTDAALYAAKRTGRDRVVIASALTADRDEGPAGARDAVVQQQDA